MSLIKLAVDNAIEDHHQSSRIIATGTGAILGGLYGGFLGARRTKKENTLINELNVAKVGIPKKQNWYQKIMKRKPTSVVDISKVDALAKSLAKSQKYRKGRMIGAGLIGAGLLGYGFNKMQDSQNKYEKALFGKK